MIIGSAHIAGPVLTPAKDAIVSQKGGLQAMTEQGKEARRQYYREYYQAHKAERQAASRRYWDRKAELQRQKPPETARPAEDTPA